MNEKDNGSSEFRMLYGKDLYKSVFQFQSTGDNSGIENAREEINDSPLVLTTTPQKGNRSGDRGDDFTADQKEVLQWLHATSLVYTYRNYPVKVNGCQPTRLSAMEESLGHRTINLLNVPSYVAGTTSALKKRNARKRMQLHFRNRRRSKRNKRIRSRNGKHEIIQIKGGENGVPTTSSKVAQTKSKTFCHSSTWGTLEQVNQEWKQYMFDIWNVWKESSEFSKDNDDASLSRFMCHPPKEWLGAFATIVECPGRLNWIGKQGYLIGYWQMVDKKENEKPPKSSNTVQSANDNDKTPASQTRRESMEIISLPSKTMLKIELPIPGKPFVMLCAGEGGK